MKKFLGKFAKQSRGEKGFTLIELLIVIAVLGILAAVIIPNVAGFIKSGKIAAANSELAAIQTAIQAYNSEYPNAAAQTESLANNFLIAYLSSPPTGVYNFIQSTGILVLDESASGHPTYGSPSFNWNGSQFSR